MRIRSSHRIDMDLIFLWFFLRVVSSLFAALFSALRPLVEIEKMIPLWPPSSLFGDWLERVFLSPWQRWDVYWYLKILSNGYNAFDGSTQFHPLYILLGKILASIGFHPILSLLIVSSCSGLLFIIIFRKLGGLDLPPEQAHFNTVFLLFFPVSVVLFAPYTEATFLLFAVLCIYWSRKRYWWLAGIAGGLASLTRQQGIILLLPMAWELWNQYKTADDANNTFKFVNCLRSAWRNWLSLILVPLGYMIWLLYRWFVLADFRPSFDSFHSFVYSIPISSSSSRVVPTQDFTWPWEIIGHVMVKLRTNPDVDIWVNLFGLILFLMLFAFVWRYLRPSYIYFVLAIFIVSVSYYTGSSHPYMGLLRHLYLGFPLFLGISSILRQKWPRVFVLALLCLGWIFLLLLFTLEAWVL